ncbi:MAG: hypothetical protein J1E31_07525 [Helicobacter sp.]|nr:hypothetical protein [Helicobacter sp.]
MIRDFALGFLRMAVSLLPCIVFFALAIDSDGDKDSFEAFLGLGLISVFVGYVWWFVDLFLVYKKAKRENYNKIVEFVFNCS